MHGEFMFAALGAKVHCFFRNAASASTAERARFRAGRL
jgi:hypothetical protein